MNKKTNWTSATHNPFKAFKGLVSCLQSGYNAWIELQENGKQDNPLLETNPNINNLSTWKSSGSYFVQDWAKEKERIENDTIHPFAKKLMLEYTTVFGSEEEYENYLKTGEVKFLGMGKKYFIRYDDLIKTREKEGIKLSDKSRYVLSVLPIEHYKQVKKTNRKVFVVCFNSEKRNLPMWLKVYNVLLYPFKFIPKRSVLRMKEYTCYTFRIGGVSNGFSIDIRIPKKFSFK